jgi:hypothetical protein
MSNANVILDVSFEAGLVRDDMPSSYIDPKYLEEVVQEAIKDAMYDMGCEQVEYIRVEIEGL